MNNFKEIIFFDDFNKIYFKDVPGYTSHFVFCLNSTNVHYIGDKYQISFEYINDNINGNYVVVRKFVRFTLEDVPFDDGELEKFYFTDNF